jgi:hypothetical protein
MARDTRGTHGRTGEDCKKTARAMICFPAGIIAKAVALIPIAAF